MPRRAPRGRGRDGGARWLWLYRGVGGPAHRPRRASGFDLEGTSNIVAQDVVRAVRREGALPVWRAHLVALLAESSWHPRPRARLDGLLERVQALAETAALQGQEALARQAATALYHLSTCVAMGWEATRTRSLRRMLLAQLVLRHKLLPQDPLMALPEPDLSPLFACGAIQGAVAALHLPG